VKTNAECGVRNAELKGKLVRPVKLPLILRIPHSAFRILLAGALIAAGCASPAGESVPVTIPPGATLEAAVDSLAARGIIEHAALFTLYARLHGLRGALKSGVYLLAPRSPWSDVVDALERGRGVEARFFVPEGLTLAEVAAAARAQLGVPRDSVLAAARDPELLHSLGLPGDARSVEGYLFPTTYLVPLHVHARDLVRVMTREFAAQWQPEWEGRLDSLHLTRHALVTLASIIEAEVRYDPDRPYVSAVYHNRLTRGMRLEADPTVAYAYGRRLRRVWEKNLAIRSPYNTYQRAGLPPGPIGQPGRASLLAALYPAGVPFQYFVAQPDGKHIFSTTYAEHLAAIRAVKRQRTAARAQPAPDR